MNDYPKLMDDFPHTQPQTLEPQSSTPKEREFVIDNLLARIHLIIEMILVDRPCAKGV